MIKRYALAAMLCMGFAIATFAQKAQNDPVIMTIDGQPVHRSEFVYSYNKNNSEGVIDKKSVEEYVDLFVNYKLRVRAALDAKLDTLSSFKKEYLEYRDMQIRPTLISESDVEAEALKIYNDTKGRIGDTLFEPAHILLKVEQKASDEELQKTKMRADSICNALKKGADFADMAQRFSDDKGSASRGGVVGWIGKGQTIKEFEDAAFALADGELSVPVQSTFGFHIIKMMGRKPFESFDSLRTDILRFIEARGIREAMINQRLEQIVASQGDAATKESVMNQRADSLAAVDPDMANLFREYYEGLLLYEISNRTVWDKATKDEEGLNAFFKKNKKKYTWDAPRFKGIAYHTKDVSDIKAVKKALKGKSFEKWTEVLRTTFNADSVLRIRAEKGIFKMGDNALVDREVFKQDKEPKPVNGYPNDAVYGTVLKAPKEMSDVRGQVTADYQDALEKAWFVELRKKYEVKVNKDVLSTVKDI